MVTFVLAEDLMINVTVIEYGKSQSVQNINKILTDYNWYTITF